ncbi:MAG: CHAD domain-containing protein [Solirubrobacteraceae bacterium]|jgi:CYTH domain-containing protein/CHAD domain-containing protein
MEIERKFLVAHPPPGLESYPHRHLAQGYLLSAGEDLEVRLRASDGHGLLTVKQGGGLAREEYEHAIEPERFERLWPLTEGHQLEKVRYTIPGEEALMIELDVYAGALDGLAIAEVEFDSEAQAQRFKPPGWFGPEVTGDRRYANQQLADEGVPSVRAQTPSFTLAVGEPVGDGLRRLVRAQIDSATDQLSGLAGSDPGEAVHEARKSFKRIRAALRLARGQLQPSVYEHELASFRDAGQQLSSARDSEVLIDTLDSLCVLYAQHLPASGFSTLRETLVGELQAAGGGPGRTTTADEAVLQELARARQRLPGWRFEHDEVEALDSGFQRIYRNGRRAVRAAAAEPSDERLHEVRKRSKELWHAAEILGEVAPQRMEPLILLAHRISDLTGDDHDLAILAQRVRERADCFADRAEQSALQRLIARRRRQLQRRALRLGARLYELEHR